MERPDGASLMHYRREKFRMLATVSVAGLFAFLPLSMNTTAFSLDGAALAQQVEATQIFDGTEIAQEEQLLLESDELIYDNDRGIVTAIGNVQIAFGEHTLVADRVEYNQLSGRVIAIGNVEILEPGGTRIFAKEIDITDDFRDGFVSALNVQTADETRIVAESAERQDGQITAFNNGVYTACKPCQENPEKPPFWQIRAKKVVVNNDKQTVEYEDASFEFFGKSVLKLSRFAHADPAVKRKSGFLLPQFKQSDELGAGTRASYFFNLAPNFDLTLSGTYYTRQGFLGEAEWRHRTENGQYNIRYAGIDQQAQGAFTAGTVDQLEDSRNALITSGQFEINPRWKFGWQALFQSDDNFARTYELEGYDARDITNEVYLTGLSGKNFFDLRAQDFLVQNSDLDFDDDATNGLQNFTDQQATVLPSFDYNRVSGEEFETGQLSLDLNVTSVNRGTFQVSNPDTAAGQQADERFTGIEGNTTRASAELEWKASHITSGGLVTTGSLSVRGDSITQNTDNPGTVNNPLTSNDSIFRTMPAGMLEIRYPLVANSGSTTHILEPIAQLVVRPDEKYIGRFANEDAQSFVFDTTNLFERDKFSGFDRVEGGTRANIGFRYAASFENGGSIDVVAGQSFHLGGVNSFAQQDLVNAGLESGLETDRSDYVASVQYNNGEGFSLGSGVRLDEQDASLKSLSVGAKLLKPTYSVQTTYTFTEAQPNYRFGQNDRHELSTSTNFRLDENWRTFGEMSYDLENSEYISTGVGLAYDNECFSFAINYRNYNADFTGSDIEQSIGFTIGLRTVGGFEHTINNGIGSSN